MATELGQARWFWSSIVKIRVGWLALTFKSLRWLWFLPCTPPRAQSAEAGLPRAEAALRLGNQQQPAQGQEAAAWAGACVGAEERGGRVLSGTRNHVRRCRRRRPCCEADGEQTEA